MTASDDKRIARRSAKLEIAASFESLGPTKAILLDKEGNIVGQAAALSGAMLGRGGLLTLTGIGAFFLGPHLGFFGMYFVSLPAILLGLRWSWDAQQINKIVAIITQDRLEEAKRRCEKTRSWFPGLNLLLDTHRGHVYWRTGDHERAAKALDAGISRAERPIVGHKSIIYWQAVLMRAQLAAVRGELDRARDLLRHAEAGPRGDYIEAERQMAKLVLAFHTDDTSALPEDLFDWIRATLTSTSFGPSVAILAWVCRRRGDDEIADLLMGQVADRIEPWHLDAAMPRLHAWIEGTHRADSGQV